MSAPSWKAKYLDGEDPTDLHAMLVAYYGDAPVTKLKAVPAGNGETMSFFYARVHTPYLMTPTHKYLVVAVLRNRDPPFQAGLRRLSELRDWTSFQTRTFGPNDLPLTAEAIEGYERPVKAAKDSGLSRIRIECRPRRPDDEHGGHGPAAAAAAAAEYGCASIPRLRVRMVPVSDRVQLATHGSLLDALETFQCTLERT